MTKLLENTIALPGSAREATTAFSEGNGDVLLSYENEAILARARAASRSTTSSPRTPCSSRTRPPSPRTLPTRRRRCSSS